MDLSKDESFGHGSIDKSEKLHGLVIEKIKKVALGPAAKKRAGAGEAKAGGGARDVQGERRKSCRQFPLSCRRKQLSEEIRPERIDAGPQQRADRLRRDEACATACSSSQR